jgi:hypothetical protein
MKSLFLTGIMLIFFVAQYAYLRKLRWVYVVCFGVAVGLLNYWMVGLGVMSLKHYRRFYSVPFGGFRLNDKNVLQSLLVWVVLWAIVAWKISGKTRKRDV